MKTCFTALWHQCGAFDRPCMGVGTLHGRGSQGLSAENNSISSGQVLQCPYDAEKAKIVLQEMADALSLELVDKRLVTDQIVITVGYDIENLTDRNVGKNIADRLSQTATDDRFRSMPTAQKIWTFFRPPHRKILDAASVLYDRVVDKSLLIRRMNITANHVVDEASASQKEEAYEQLDLFSDYKALEEKNRRRRRSLRANVSFRRQSLPSKNASERMQS